MTTTDILTDKVLVESVKTATIHAPVERLEDLGVSALIRKTAHPEMVDIVRHLLAPRLHGHRDEFDAMT